MHVSHGLCCAMYLPPVMEFNLIACPSRFARIAELLGENIAGLPDHQAAKEAVMAVEELFAPTAACRPPLPRPDRV
jgi:alcohol dehydrogenase class IV